MHRLNIALNCSAMACIASRHVSNYLRVLSFIFSGVLPWEHNKQQSYSRIVSSTHTITVPVRVLYKTDYTTSVSQLQP